MLGDSRGWNKRGFVFMEFKLVEYRGGEGVKDR